MKSSCTVQASLVVLYLLPLLTFSMPAAGQETSQKSPPHTVAWYADHQQERAQTQLTCIDDPGHLSLYPDCVNAQKASVEVALREARTHTGTTDPRDPAFWSADPETRHNHLLLCRRNPQLANCDAAKRSLEIEAGQVKR